MTDSLKGPAQNQRCMSLSKSKRLTHPFFNYQEKVTAPLLPWLLFCVPSEMSMSVSAPGGGERVTAFASPGSTTVMCFRPSLSSHSTVTLSWPGFTNTVAPDFPAGMLTVSDPLSGKDQVAAGIRHPSAKRQHKISFEIIFIYLSLCLGLAWLFIHRITHKWKANAACMDGVPRIFKIIFHFIIKVGNCSIPICPYRRALHAQGSHAENPVCTQGGNVL